MKNITEAEYEVVARQRAKLADGSIGWTGIYRAAYSFDRTVVGRGRDFIFLPSAYLEGSAGGSGERAYAKIATQDHIARFAALVAGERDEQEGDVCAQCETLLDERSQCPNPDCHAHERN
jgi:hypothetical protein